MKDLQSLYKQTILQHSQNPKNFGELDNPTHSAEGDNPLCGDRITVQMIMENEAIQKIKFSGVGCSICMASASLMTEQLWGKTSVEATALAKLMSTFLHKELPEPELSTLGELIAFTGVKRFPSRIQCAELPWGTLIRTLSSQ